MIPLIVKLGETTWWHMECTICKEKFDYKECDGMITCPNCGAGQHTSWIKDTEKKVEVK
jgi:hypothetical protein